jgi:ribosomal protein S18 acetylase RimI-like enzyme
MKDRGPLVIEDVPPTSAVAAELIDELSAVLEQRYGSRGRGGFDAPSEHDGVVFLVARLDGRAVGCGALRPLVDGICEIKRMYSRPGTSGVGQAVLAALEARALALGFENVRLETRRVNHRAVAFYTRAGYGGRPPYGKYAGRPEAICMEKNLDRPSAAP